MHHGSQQGRAPVHAHEAGLEWGLPLGVDQEQRLRRTKPFRSVLIACREPRSGKNRLALMPMLLAWLASALVILARVDLVRLTRKTRALRGAGAGVGSVRTAAMRGGGAD